jgi:hypothetical protein
VFTNLKRLKILNDQYQIVRWDNENRFLVIKNGQEGYLVELHLFGKGRHYCGCRWYETKTIQDAKRASPCKHVLMVNRIVESHQLFEQAA